MVDFSKADVRTAAILADEETSPVVLAKKYGVSRQTVANIKTLMTKRAKRMAERMREMDVPVRNWDSTARFSDEQIRAIRAAKGSSTKIAAQFGCSASNVRMIKTRKTYRDVTDG